MTPKERAAVSIQNESETVSSLSMMRTAMQQALEALEYLPEMRGIEEAITALREALEQPNEIDWIETNKALSKEIIEMKKQAEQEPVAIVEVNQMGIPEITWDKFDEYAAGRYELYAAPVRTKDLTDGEILTLVTQYGIDDPQWFARAVIAADREKNRAL